MPSFLSRASFLAKLAGALVLVAAADQLFYQRGPGSTIGLFAIAWAAVLAAAVPALRRSRPALVALAAAFAFGAILFDDPNPLAWMLFWIALSMAALLPRLRGFDTASLWAARLLIHFLTGPGAVVVDAVKLGRLGPCETPQRVRSALPVLALPVAGALIFFALFASANPVIANVLAAIRLPRPDWGTIGHVLFWVIIFYAIWPTFRPRKMVTRLPQPVTFGELTLPGVSVASVTLSLIVFNLIFALQNALDIVFLWSGAPLPEGVTLAEYAHRGAYPLIATALLAGLFVLVTLRPGSETAGRPLVRRLVVAWVAQNVLLVASSILRTIDYIDAFSLTKLRIAALAWMVLVAAGLVLICWRMMRGRSSAWLINANAAAAALVLALASVVDLGAIAAGWNVRHAREAGGRGAPLDLCYLRHLGAPALLPLIELERRPLELAFGDRVRWTRGEVLRDLEREQQDGWTWRGDRRLEAARASLGPLPPLAAPAPHGRDCNGRPNKPQQTEVAPPAPVPAAAPKLTAETRP